MKNSTQKIKTIAIDDEPKALEIMQLHAAKVPFLELVATFREPLPAIEWLQANEVDLVLLDINMPRLSGLQFRGLVGPDVPIIFTTAYSEYAVESYEQNAIDYLLKPIQFPRFLQAVMKVRQRQHLAPQVRREEPSPQSATENFLYVKSGTKRYRLATAEIRYLEKDGNYIFFHSLERKVMSRMSMQQAMEVLPTEKFVQTHRSWIVNLQHVEVVENHQLSVAGVAIPIGKNYREEVLGRIG